MFTYVAVSTFLLMPAGLQISEVVDQFGPVLGGAILIISAMAGVVAFLDRRADRLYGLRLQEMETQYEARLKAQGEQYEARLREQSDSSKTRLDDFKQLVGYQQVLMQRGLEVNDTAIRELAPRATGR